MNRNNFKTEECYKTFMWAKGIAENINQLIAQGCNVLDNYDTPIKHGFVFERNGLPCIAEKVDERKILNYTTYKEGGKICMIGQSSRQFLEKTFRAFKVVRPVAFELGKIIKL